MEKRVAVSLWQRRDQHDNNLITHIRGNEVAERATETNRHGGSSSGHDLLLLLQYLYRYNQN
jgi:hypothetical protein